jgi:Protein of unknown function (DUF3667)
MSHKKYRSETTCLNCGTEVKSKFCPECGQENLETRESFVHLAFHTIGDFFHFDSKFFRSLIPLAAKPGFLTIAYWSGKRMHYIHPLRLFFFITIVMVIVANAYYNKYEQQIKAEKIVRTDSPDNKNDTRDKATIERQNRKVVEGVDKTFDYASTYLKYISFLLLPVYALVFRMLYFRHKRFYIEHLVYTLHLQSFVYIIVSAVLLIPLFITPTARSWFMNVILLSLAVYTLLSLRRIYRQSWIKTFLKTVLAMGFIFLVTVFFLASIMFINIFG